MKKTLLSIILLSFLSVGAFAQSTAKVAKAEKAHDPREKCLMATGADWARLGIDQSQIMRVNAIQSTCMQDCVAAKESGSDLRSVIDRHIADLRTVLSPDQFAQWEDWCKGKTEAVE